MISDEKQYEFVTSQVAARDQKAADVHFKFFVQWFSAIVGGAMWLSMQPDIQPTARPIYRTLSDALIILLTIISIILVIDNFRAWRGYRTTHSKLVGKDETGNYRVPLPKVFPAAITEATVVACMIAVCVLFFWFNPFAI